MEVDKPKKPAKAAKNKTRRSSKKESRPLVSITTTSHVEGDGVRNALLAQSQRFYDDLQWRTEETHKGEIDRLMGRRKA